MRRIAKTLLACVIAIQLSACFGSGSSGTGTTGTGSAGTGSAGTGSAGTGAEQTNTAPVYTGGLQSHYQAFNGETVSLDQATFSDSDNDALTVRYYTTDNEGNITYLDNRLFVCDASITGAGAEASDGKLTTHATAAEVDCYINSLQTTTLIESNSESLGIIGTHTDIELMQMPTSVVLTLERDINNDDQTDLVFGVGLGCEQNQYSDFNASPVMPIELATTDNFNRYPQHLICLDSTTSEEALLAQLTTHLNEAQVADLLVMGTEVRIDANDDMTVLHNVTAKRWQSGKFEILASKGVFQVLGEHSQSSTIVCGTQQLQFVAVQSQQDSHQRLTRFELDTGQALAELNSGAVNNCTITNRKAVVNQLPSQVALGLEFDDVEPKENVTFSQNNIDAVDFAYFFAVGDINGDGLGDVVTSYNKKLFWFQQQADGDFSSRKMLIDDQQRLVDVAVGDIDGDGLNDLVTLNSNQLAWYKNNAGNGFSAANVISEGEFFVASPIFAGRRVLQALDINADGKVDVVFRDHRSNQLWAYYRQEDGFSQRVTLLELDDEDEITSVRFADFNNDSINDLLVGSNVLTIMLGTEDGGFSTAKTVTLQESILDFDIVDIENDGTNELVVVFPLAATIYRQDGDNIALWQQFRTGIDEGIDMGWRIEGFHSLALTKREGSTDLFLMHRQEYYQMSNGTRIDFAGEYLRFDSSGAIIKEQSDIDVNGFNPTLLPTGSEGALSLLAINYDTKALDRAVLSKNAELDSTASIGVSDKPQTHTLDVGDLDGDGKKDLILTGGKYTSSYQIDETVTTWMFNQSKWQKQPAFGLHFTTEPKPQIFYVDDDVDGDVDIIYQKDSIVYRVNNNGDGFAPRRTTLFEPSDFELEQIIDLNGDGKLDFLGMGETSVKTFMTTEDGVIAGHSFDHEDKSILDVADYNADGRLDLVLKIRKMGISEVSLYLNLETGFKPLSGNFAENLDREFMSIDYNGDGFLDIVYSVPLVFYEPKNDILLVRYNDGHGQFGPPIPLLSQSAERVETLAQGDFNGDGKQDLVAISRNWGVSRHVHVFLRGQDNALSLALSHSLNQVDSSSWYSFYNIRAVSDFNNDGRDDLVVQTLDSQFGYVSGDYAVVLVGDNGEFSLSNTLSSVSLSPSDSLSFRSSVKVFDYDNDGDMDVAIAWLGYTTISENLN